MVEVTNKRTDENTGCSLGEIDGELFYHYKNFQSKPKTKPVYIKRWGAKLVKGECNYWQLWLPIKLTTTKETGESA